MSGWLGALLALVCGIVCSAYAFLLICPRHTVSARLGFTAPAFLFLWLAPLMLFDRQDTLTGLVMSSALLSWWPSFRLLSLACYRGPLVHEPRFLAFTAKLLLPVKVQDSSNSKGSATQWTYGQYFMSFVGKFCLALVFIRFYFVAPLLASSAHARALFVCIRVLWALIVYLVISGSMDLPASVAHFFGVNVADHFDRPFLSTSLADFWSRRWNLTCGSILRESVYEPMLDLYPLIFGSRSSPGRGLKRKLSDPSLSRLSLSHCASHFNPISAVSHAEGHPDARCNSTTASAVRCAVPNWWHTLSVLMVFLSSAVAHEVISFYATGQVYGEWFGFFAVHGVAVVVEGALLRSMGLSPGKLAKSTSNSSSSPPVVTSISNLTSNPSSSSSNLKPPQSIFMLRLPLIRQLWRALTLCFILVSSELLFWPVVDKTGWAAQMLNEWATTFGLL